MRTRAALPLLLLAMTACSSTGGPGDGGAATDPLLSGGRAPTTVITDAPADSEAPDPEMIDGDLQAVASGVDNDPTPSSTGAPVPPTTSNAVVSTRRQADTSTSRVTTTAAPATTTPTTASTTAPTTSPPSTSATTSTSAPTTSTTTTQTTTTSTTTTTADRGPVQVRLQRELVDELNRRRTALGLPEVAFDAGLAQQAASCAERSLRQNRLEHCGHEVLFMGSGSVDNTSAAGLLDAWMASDGHRRALTYASSTAAGGAVISIDGQRGVTAAININY